MVKKTVIFGLFILGSSLHAEDRDIAVTVYNSNLALVREVRKMPVKLGRSELRFLDVASKIDPTSVHFKSLTSPDRVSILEQNYEYDLVSSEKILSKYLDQDIEIHSKEGKTYKGKLLSHSRDVVLAKRGGGIQSVSKSGILNIDFPNLPLGLITRPTLVWQVQSGKQGDHDMEISYLTSGIRWHAEYVGVVDSDDKKIELSAWVSIDNRSGASYESAKIKLIAGDLHRITPKPVYKARPVAMEASMMGDARQFKEKSFFEYHLYTLSRPATIRNNQIKQLSLFPSAISKIKKIFEYDGAKTPDKVKVMLEFTNSKEENLGMPFPEGKIRIYKKDADQSQEFIGEDKIKHTPKDEMVRLTVGNAFDVVGERKKKEIKNLGKRSKQETYEIKLRNHKKKNVEVFVIEHLWGKWKIVKSNYKYKKMDANTAEFNIPVKKDSETVVTYTVHTRW